MGKVQRNEFGEKIIIGYGDGNISINANTLDTETTLFELPFAGSILSTESIPGYGNPISIKTRSVTGSGNNLSINNQTADPRLLIVDPQKTFPIKTRRLLADGITAEVVTVNLRACWFAGRPQIVSGGSTAYSLSFAKVDGMYTEQTLTDRYFDGLQQVLRRMRVLTMSMLLSPEDISNLDFSRPIRIRDKRVGRLHLSDHFFYLNKIADYQARKTCLVTLIAF